MKPDEYRHPAAGLSAAGPPRRPGGASGHQDEASDQHCPRPRRHSHNDGTRLEPAPFLAPIARMDVPLRRGARPDKDHPCDDLGHCEAEPVADVPDQSPYRCVAVDDVCRESFGDEQSDDRHEIQQRGPGDRHDRQVMPPRRLRCHGGEDLSVGAHLSIPAPRMCSCPVLAAGRSG